jgi:hypothetical protein
MSDLTEVGERDNWICWLCDTPVDPEASVNSDLGPSTDSFAAAKAKGGREIVARCPDQNDANQAAEWLLDRLGRLSPGTRFSTEITPGGGQFMLTLRIDR